MGRQIIAMRVGVWSMTGRKGRFRDGLMLLMRQGTIDGMMAGIFQMTFTVHAGSGLQHCFFLIHARGRGTSCRHIQ